MHSIEPYFNWRELYTAEEDERSPFYGREYSEFEFTNTIYNYFVHPQWDDFGSATLYMKVLFTDYDLKYVIIELIGEWNDALYNDIMVLKRDIIDHFINEGVNHFIVVGENVLNFHYSDESYYEEWYEDAEEGWITFINFQPHVLTEMKRARIDWYVNWGGELNELPWRTYRPQQLFAKIKDVLGMRLG